MGRHDDLLGQGPREAPEPETAEERTRRAGIGAAAGGILAAGVAALKVGGASKFLFWLLALHWLSNGWQIGGWIAVAVIVTLLALLAVVRLRAGRTGPATDTRRDAETEQSGGRR